jgi:hypothetical protein
VRIAFFAFSVSAVLLAGVQEATRVYKAKPETLPRQVEAQPLPFSHRKHAGAGISCKYCHPTSESKDWAGLPGLDLCAACHKAITVESHEIQSLLAKHEAGEKTEWIRVYDVPGYVFFSHASHVRKEVTCETCHGPVRERDVLAQEVSVSMTACMNCHAERKVENHCHFCHSLGH